MLVQYALLCTRLDARKRETIILLQAGSLKESVEESENFYVCTNFSFRRFRFLEYNKVNCTYLLT